MSPNYSISDPAATRISASKIKKIPHLAQVTFVAFFTRSEEVEANGLVARTDLAVTRHDSACQNNSCILQKTTRVSYQVAVTQSIFSRKTDIHT